LRHFGLRGQAGFGDFKTPDGFHFGLLDSMESQDLVEVATSTNQNDKTVLGPERRHNMETSESSRKGKGIDCDDKWQG
jgi:hypothetical protein